MKLDQLRTIIREEVRAAIKEELQEVLTEAVKIASAPKQTFYTKKTPTEVVIPTPSRTNPVMGGNSIDEMLTMTKANMTPEEFNNITGAQPPSTSAKMASKLGMQQGALPGIDISKLDFVNKAKDVLEASYQKDKVRLG
jgi:hypothetical protein